MKTLPARRYENVMRSKQAGDLLVGFLLQDSQDFDEWLVLKLSGERDRLFPAVGPGKLTPGGNSKR
jgi:hypothetical protein